MQEKDIVIRLSGVTYDYTRQEGEDTAALRGIDLEIKRGSFVAVIGHNGSGKSTLAKLLNGLFLPKEGAVEIMSMDTALPEHIWDIRQMAGLVFQNPDNQMVTTVVEEDVAFGPENMGVEPSEIRRRVDEALELVGMTDYAQRAPHMLSGGQKQRIAIAGILAMRPKIIILDEPTAMLDPLGRQEVLETVHRLNRQEGMTVVYITHFMNEAAQADRIVVMEEGEIVMDGAPREVFSNLDKLHEVQLDVPLATQLACDLRSHGIDVAGTPIDIDELVEELCRLL
ncbi:MAG: energy-coupling factor transporter ATPase [Christensenellales bacterium]